MICLAGVSTAICCRGLSGLDAGDIVLCTAMGRFPEEPIPRVWAIPKGLSDPACLGGGRPWPNLNDGPRTFIERKTR